MYCIVMYCIVLYCIVLYCIVLYCIVLYCNVLYCIVFYRGLETLRGYWHYNNIRVFINMISVVHWLYHLLIHSFSLSTFLFFCYFSILFTFFFFFFFVFHIFLFLINVFFIINLFPSGYYYFFSQIFLFF